MHLARVSVPLYLILLRSTLIAAEITWENCGGDLSPIRLLNLTVSPNPVVIPGSISVDISLHNDKDLDSPIKAEVTLSRKMLFGYISVPCVSGVGSCTYDDICQLCPQCGCPLKAGDHKLTLPFTIYIGSWTLVGNYKAQVDIIMSTGDEACIKINNVHIATAAQ